ncbi:MAG: ADOP family duplicated permease [Acidobacteriota bacterium]
MLTLAIGAGAVGTMYGFLRRLLLQPPPQVADPARVARLFFHYDKPGAARVTRSQWYACVHDRLRAEAVTLQHAAAHASFVVSVGAGQEAASARASVVSAGFWASLGTRPTMGRLFADAEVHRVTGPRLVILGHAFWQQRYGGDRDVIGRTLRIRGEPFEIIGVTPRGFRGIELDEVDLWLPLSAFTLTGRPWETDTALSHVVRLKPGVTAEQADADLSRALSDVVDDDVGCESSPASSPPAARLSVTAGPLTAGLGGDMQLIAEARVALWLVGVAIALLGVACANAVGLLLVRALHRRREIAVRLALGMSRRRLAAQLLTESAVLAVLGSLAAVAVVGGGGAWINGVLFPNLGWRAVDIVDPSVMALTGACIIGAALVAGLAPMLQVRAHPLPALQGGTWRTTARRGRLHRTLLVAQVALSTVLLVGAGLFVRSLHNIRSLDFGLDTDNVLVVTVDFVGIGRPAREVAAFYERALERVQGLPAVERASLATAIPLRSARAKSIRPMDRAERLSAPGGEATYANSVTPGFFATTGTRVIEGRDFLPHERNGAPVVVVNEAVARAGWPGGTPVGECVEIDARGPCATVVGVVENARRFFLREDAALLFYEPVPREADDLARGALFVRIAPRARDVGAEVTRTVQALEPDLPFVQVRTLGDALDRQIRPWRLGAAVFTSFGILAALLAAMGLYGALSYVVNQRSREIGVRIAVGARAADVVRLVVRDGLGVALAGVLVGVAISLAGGRWIAGLLFDVSPRDPAVFTAVAVLLLAAALVSALVPSRRATRVDPVVAMRVE